MQSNGWQKFDLRACSGGVFSPLPFYFNILPKAFNDTSKCPELVNRNLRNWLSSSKGMAVVRTEQDSYHSFLIECSLWAHIPSPTLNVSEKRHSTTPLSIVINYPSPTSSIIKIEESSFPQICFSFDSHAKMIFN